MRLVNLNVLLLVVSRVFINGFQSQTFPVAPLIVHPRYHALLSVSPSETNEGNYHDIILQVNFTPLAPFITSQSEASKYRLLVIVDGFQKFKFHFPWSTRMLLSLRLGSHVIDIAFEQHIIDDIWELRTLFDRCVFDIIPTINDDITESSRFTFTNHLLNNELFSSSTHRNLLPIDKVYACTIQEHTQKVKIALIGSLELSGQNFLALEQAKRLRNLCVVENNEITTFEVIYFSNAKQGPFVDLLQQFGVELRLYEVILEPPPMIDAIKWLVDTLASASSFIDLKQRNPSIGESVSDLISSFQGIDIMSFTNHESMALNDRMLIECARLAGVDHVLNEPSNIWWGEPPTAYGVSGLILPSAFAANFWLQHPKLVNHFPNLNYYVINPGIEFPLKPNLFDLNSPRRNNVMEEEQVLMIGWAGRVESQKAPGLFIRMAAAVKTTFAHHQGLRICFVMAGGGTMLGDITNTSTNHTTSNQGLGPMPTLSKAVGLEAGSCYSSYRQQSLKTHPLGDIEFLGAMSHDEMLAVIADMDMIIHTNVLEETFCMVNTEAMARGVPVVSFGVGGVGEYLDIEHSKELSQYNDSNRIRGVIVQPASIGSLVRNVVQLVEDRKLRQLISKNAIHFVKEEKDMTNDRMAKQYAKLYSNLFLNKETSKNELYLLNEDHDHSSRPSHLQFSWVDRLKYRRYLDHLVMKVGGGDNPKEKVIDLMNELSNLFNCLYEVVDSDFLLSSPPRSSSPVIIINAINASKQLISTSPPQYIAAICRLTLLTNKLHNEQFGKVDEKFQYRISPLLACRYPQWVALTAHVVAGMIQMALEADNRQINQSRRSTLTSKHVHYEANSQYDTKMLSTLHRIMLKLWECTIVISPISKDPYIFAARERIGPFNHQHNDDDDDDEKENWDLASEWLRRLSILRRPPPVELQHELIWTPPLVKDHHLLVIDLVINQKEETLSFPFYPFNFNSSFQEVSRDKLSDYVQTMLSLQKNYDKNDMSNGDIPVWCRWSCLVWDGIKETEHLIPWFEAFIIHNSSGQYDHDPTPEMPPDYLRKHFDWVAVIIPHFGESKLKWVPIHHVYIPPLPPLSSSSVTAAAINKEKIDSITNMIGKDERIITSFCIKLSRTLDNVLSNSFLARCFHQVNYALMEARKLNTLDPIALKSPVFWAVGDAWEDNTITRDPFSFTTTSKLIHDAEQIEHVISLLRSDPKQVTPLYSEYNDDDDNVNTCIDATNTTNQIKLMIQLEQIGFAYRELSKLWLKSDEIEQFELKMKLNPTTTNEMFRIDQKVLYLEQLNASIQEQVFQWIDIVMATNRRILFHGYGPALSQHLKERNATNELIDKWKVQDNGKFISINSDTYKEEEEEEEDRELHDKNESSLLFELNNKEEYDSLTSTEKVLIEQGWVVIDSVFSSQVITSLRQICEEGTTFFDLKRGYYGAYLSDGFADGITFQAASIFRQKFPNTIGREPLTQLWAYKQNGLISYSKKPFFLYDASLSHGIRMHVDQGMYSVNCWITPNRALMDNEDVEQDGEVQQKNDQRKLRKYHASNSSSGLRIFTDSQEVFSDGDFKKANQDFRALRKALKKITIEKNKVKNKNKKQYNQTVLSTRENENDDDSLFNYVDIPYEENRCLIFQSDLAHETAPVRFKPGYRNRRLNLVFMFGLSRQMKPKY